MKKMLERFPFYLFFLPVFVIIHFEKDFHSFVRYEFIYDRIIILFIVPLLFFLLFYFIYRSSRKAFMLSFATLVIFCFTGDLKNKLAYSFPNQFWSHYTFLLPVLLLVLVILFFVFRKSTSNFSGLYFFINLALFLFIIADLAEIILKPAFPKYRPVNEKEITSTKCNTCNQPDIYYFLADAYTSSAILKEDFNYKNSWIEDDLRNKGFFIFSGSKSNYNYTAFSLGSTLSLDYLKGVDTTHKTTDREYLQALEPVYKNHLIEFLKKENYLIFNHSFFDFKDVPTSIRGVDFWNIRNLFDQYNLILKLVRDAGFVLPEKIRNIFHESDYDINKQPGRKRLLTEVSEHLMISARVKSDQPKFVFTHFIEPHPPFYFDSLGHVFKYNVSIQEGYIHSIAYTNRLIKKATDSILAYTTRPCVIIIQGDHGCQFYESATDEKRLAVFHAVYFSNGNYDFYSDSVINVNTFRIVLNTFFKKNYPMLENKSFFLR